VKTLSIAVHYRYSRSKAATLGHILQVVRRLERIRIVPGNRVVNLIPLQVPGKGVALRQACRRLRCSTALYVGDDASDEDAFASAGSSGLIGVRVRRTPASRAPFFLPRQDDVDMLLSRLIALRREPLASQPLGPKAAVRGS
jgi:trehalose-phosphatase